ncbi:MAG TPA: type II toxin-antitoxin system RelE/ParE family toxin [Thermoanaerobaculia bacterium]|jgi:plasmid stabilization system protein ParE|nr:type II toxin-antitoxin system RelE/ParE family toxin [Thermoanaerobaculia bacterium]
MIAPSLIRPEAQADIEEAAFWYEDQRLGLGERFTGELFELIRRISEAPLQFPSIGDAVRRGLLHKFPYAVYFLVEDDQAVIIAVLHQRRDPAVWKSRV